MSMSRRKSGGSASGMLEMGSRLLAGVVGLI
jgi:hypothetical protein